MPQQQPDFSELWIQHQRRNNKTTQSWACLYCLDRRIFLNAEDLWSHALLTHSDKLPQGDDERGAFRTAFESDSALKRNNPKDDSRKPNFNEGASAPAEPPVKRPLNNTSPLPQTRSLSGIGALNLNTPGSEDIPMQDVSDDSQGGVDQPRKRAALGDGISAGSFSPRRDSSSSPSPRRSKARPTSAPYGGSDTDVRQDMLDITRRQIPKGQLWTPDQEPLSRALFDPSNIASLHTQKNRAQGFQQKSRKATQSSPQGANSRPPINHNVYNATTPATIIGNKITSTAQHLSALPKDENYDIVLQPETRPISQEQLVAEVKGIYAGLVMVEAKCIEVDNKQATLAQADPGAQPKLNNEQWQALIALHRTLLHEHHDFFLASQHPSASPALRRLASKYAMPARMWRHGIHSFLELLRHRLPASLDHMLAFIYLAYSMMALLYETVPAFEDTWIECLGDLGRYRMAIEDDDIRDREVWTGVARHWYSKASDKAPTTGRLYHHLAILARPNALQQLFYYAKSLCVVFPFTSARESILTLFEPVLNAENGQGQYRLPPLDTAFVKAHGLLFTARDMNKFEPAVNEFLSLLDSQIGRVTRKFMEQGYHIAVANSVAMLGFASKDNNLFKAIIPSSNKDGDVQMAGALFDDNSASMVSFKNAQRLSNSTLEIVLQRIGDPNVLPFIHVTLVFMYCISRHPVAMSFLQADFPWELLSVFLNTLLGVYETPGRIENDKFPLPEKDDVRPFPEDFAMRGLLWTENYFPDQWFANEKIDEEEKYHELASMTAQRKERIMWLACSISSICPCLIYNGQQFLVPSSVSRSSTFASVTTVNTIDRAETWTTIEEDIEDQSDAEEDSSSSTMPAAQSPSHD